MTSDEPRWRLGRHQSPGTVPEYRIEGDVTGGTWQITRDGVPLGPPVPYNAPPGVEHYADDSFAAQVESTDIGITRDQTGWIRDMAGCCDMHGRTCEPPSELCCDACTEAAHQMGDATLGVHLRDGTRCSNPDLSRTRPDPLEPGRD
jgi:hypothetical protein